MPIRAHIIAAWTQAALQLVCAALAAAHFDHLALVGRSVLGLVFLILYVDLLRHRIRPLVEAAPDPARRAGIPGTPDQSA